MKLTLDDLGLPAITEAFIDAGHAARVAATLDGVSACPVRARLQEGSPLPALWHWCYFTPTVATSSLGQDGHATVSSRTLAPFPRRMWASGKVRWDRPLNIGQVAIRHTDLVGARSTSGRSGDFVVVELEHTYRQDGTTCIVEEQSLIYRPTGLPIDLPVATRAPDPSGWTRTFLPTEPLLFRFSAVTFNSHRIHYDRTYAEAVEGYPDLVVQGPLSALMGAEAIRSTSKRDFVSLEFRARAPLFVGQPVVMVGTPIADDVTVRLMRIDGVEAVTVSAELAGT